MKSSTIIKSAVATGALAVAGVTTVSANTVTVKSGDTLYRIAAENGTSVAELAKANGIADANLIFIGQQLNTQTSSATPKQESSTSNAAPANNGTYAVKSGDTLYHIAASNGVSLATLVAANNIQNINYISVGQVLNLSGHTAANTTQAPAASAQTQTSSAATTTPAAPAQAQTSSAATTAPVVPVQQTPAPAAANDNQVLTEKVAYIAAADTDKDGFMSAAEYNTYKANGGDTTPAPKVAPQVQPAQAAQSTPAAAPAQVTPTANTAAATPASVAPVANSTAQTLLNSLNAKRAALGLSQVTLDAGLTARAQARAANAVANGGLPTNHFATNGEVVAIGWGLGQVIDAWYNETNMVTNGTPGHRMWVANANATSVGFGIVGGTIVAESNVGQY